MQDVATSTVRLVLAFGVLISSGTTWAAYQEVAVKGGGALNGTVRWTGAIPKPEQITPTTDKKVCHAHPETSLTIDKKTRGVKNGVVLLVGITKGKAFASKKVTINQTGCEFKPRVVVIPAGGKIVFENCDPVLHNIHTHGRRNRSVNEAMPASAKPLVKSFPRREFVRVTCDIHSWMGGYIVVTDHPYVAVTDEKGRFSIADIPPGKYRVAIWHESRRKIEFDPKSADVTIESGKTLKVDFTAKKRTSKKKRRRR